MGVVKDIFRMIEADRLMDELNDLGVSVYLDGEQVRCSDQRLLSNDLIERFEQSKDEIKKKLINSELTNLEIIEQQRINIDSLHNFGLALLPDDRKFLLKILPTDARERREALKHYIFTWRHAMTKEPTDHKKQNAGRRAANQMILNYKGEITCQ